MAAVISSLARLVNNQSQRPPMLQVKGTENREKVYTQLYRDNIISGCMHACVRASTCEQKQPPKMARHGHRRHKTADIAQCLQVHLHLVAKRVKGSPFSPQCNCRKLEGLQCSTWHWPHHAPSLRRDAFRVERDLF